VTARELALRVVIDVFPPPSDKPGVTKGRRRGVRIAAFDYRVPSLGLERARCGVRRPACLWRNQNASYARLVSSLDPAQDEKNKALPPAIRELLRLAIYELVYTHADEYATLFEFVNLAKRFGHRGWRT